MITASLRTHRLVDFCVTPKGRMLLAGDFALLTILLQRGHLLQSIEIFVRNLGYRVLYDRIY
jgi:hypothetical protein